MKRLLIAMLCFISLQASAQKDTSIRKTSIAICNCLEKQKIAEAKTEQAMQTIFLKCFMDSAMNLLTTLASDGGDYEEAGRQIGEKVAMDLLAMGCEPFLKMSMNVAQSKSSSSEGSKSSKSNNKNPSPPPIK